ncbi:hypothetical protein PG994_004903 [Apiospora phragmitis]|uniref:Uncharacterized protein n=1 Tax=Apiospora phragmitis TaxID=2905665 RepID=A0ABR1VRW8_9PEZI
MSLRKVPDSPLASSLAKRVKTNHASNSFFNDPIVKIEVEDVEHGTMGLRTWYLHRRCSWTSPWTSAIGSATATTPSSSGTRVLKLSRASATGSTLDVLMSLNSVSGRLTMKMMVWAKVSDNDDGRDEEEAREEEEEEDGDLQSGFTFTGNSPSPDSETLVASPLLTSDHDHAPISPSPPSEAAVAAAAHTHPVDRVITRLLDLYTFAQHHALPALARDVLSLLQDFRADHRAERPRLCFAVLRRACDGFRDDADPLWRWLAADFARSCLHGDDDDDDDAASAAAAINEMCARLPPMFWRAVFKAKVAADADTIGYLRRLREED